MMQLPVRTGEIASHRRYKKVPESDGFQVLTPVINNNTGFWHVMS
jgi:hypothetical protein